MGGDPVQLTFLGVRGSTPAPGPDFIRYGGHTSCVAVRRSPEELPTLVLDAGTGLRNLTPLLKGAAFDGSILLSHLHWDHVQGFPFFSAGDRDDARVDVYMAAQDGRSARDLMAQFMSPPAFPITPEGLRGDWTLHTVEAGGFTAEGYSVTSFDVSHKGGRTYGYRIEHGGSSVVYVPDHAPEAGISTETLAAFEGVDVFIHDAQFLDFERPRAVDYGHATVNDTVRLAEAAGVGRIVLFHHGPMRTDNALDRIMDGIACSLPVVVAREGLTIEV